MSMTSNPLTEEIKALIGMTAEKVEASPPWGIDREGLRIFTNAMMDPDPRYWDDDFAKTTRFAGIVAPPIYCSYIGRKTLAGTDDPITQAFHENPTCDGIDGVRDGGADQKGALPPVPTPLKRILNAGNEIEIYKYPVLGDRIYSQAKYSQIEGRITKDGTPMLVVTVQRTYTNQNHELLCILRASSILR
ncbi:MaoC family dehydratase N-terminal domain-containing protein [Bradyrhizobium sp. 183]|uniref:FAS1-like dehydratase domain-containing protein n=1 Tax=unclassified Bradyrhizobium TaxID=2631580 RepID=UPI001FFFEFC7|nr:MULTISPECIES: MaoC family dehydratase N-terminal domain-containing protein [unclassified Bradyrhizobium]UPJ79349.1 MaoC family dehydratase N-terminal domain-containing protein [Bradyrhizobium sp. 184]UPJ87143.1 MaoC family dehydratase N-terminal domain-containing protein [Bradyrhizobium sp. 183]